MAQFMVKAPVGVSAVANGLRRKRVRAGLSAMYVRSTTILPGPNVFKGLGAFFAQAPTVFPGPDVFTPFIRRSGLRAFRASVMPAPTFPGPNIFVPFLRGAGGQAARECSSCSKPCSKRKAPFRKGMGDDGTDSDLSSLVGATYDAPTYSAYTYGGDLGTAPTFDVPSDLPSSLTMPVITGLPGAVSTNPSLDATNQALTNAMGSNASTTTLQALTAATQAAQLGKALTPAQQQLVTQYGAKAQTGTFNLGNFVSQYGGLLLLGTAGVVGLSLLFKKKGKR